MSEFLSTPEQTNNSISLTQRTVLIGAAALSLACGITSTASADTADHTYSVANTDGAGVWLHEDPGLEDSGDLIKIMPEGTTFTADCLVYDTPIGPNGNRIWLHGSDGTDVGYVTDHYSDSVWSSSNTLERQGLPTCNDLWAPTNPATSSGEGAETLHFDPQATADWARDHAQDRPPKDSSCTNFISQALWAGGLPENSEWTDDGPGYGYLWQHRPGTPSAWAVEAFLDHVTETYPHAYQEEIDVQRFRENSLPEASIGSVIMYDWEGDGEYDHAAIVTGIEAGDYPEVSEWSAYDGRTPTPYIERGWTYSEKQDEWLEATNPNMTARIIDFNTTIGRY